MKTDLIGTLVFIIVISMFILAAVLSTFDNVLAGIYKVTNSDGKVFEGTVGIDCYGIHVYRYGTIATIGNNKLQKIERIE